MAKQPGNVINIRTLLVLNTSGTRGRFAAMARRTGQKHYFHYNENMFDKVKTSSGKESVLGGLLVGSS